MNKSLIVERFSKALSTYSEEASVQRIIAERMTTLVGEHVAMPQRKIFEFGCGTGNYSRMLLHQFHPTQLILNDICKEVEICLDDLFNEQVSFIAGDAEKIVLPQENTLITSCSALQWFDAPESFFQRCHSSLTAEGYLAFSTFGTKNMQEIKQLTGKGLTYRPLEELVQSLDPSYTIVHSEEQLIPLTFSSPMEVLYHLKRTGVTGLSKQSWTRTELTRFCEEYMHTFGKQSTVSLTYHPIYVIARKNQ